MTPDAEDIGPIEKARDIIEQAEGRAKDLETVLIAEAIISANAYDVAKALLRAVEVLEWYAEHAGAFIPGSPEDGLRRDEGERARECLASLGVANVPK